MTYSALASSDSPTILVCYCVHLGCHETWALILHLASARAAPQQLFVFSRRLQEARALLTFPNTHSTKLPSPLGSARLLYSQPGVPPAHLETPKLFESPNFLLGVPSSHLPLLSPTSTPHIGTNPRGLDAS